MRHSLEPEYRKYVKGYGILSFARNFGDKYGKKLMNTTIKTGTNFNSKYGKKLTGTAIKTGFAAIADKNVVQKSAEATGDLIGNKIDDKITSMGCYKEEVKPRSKKEKDETKIMEETQEIYIPPEKRKQIIKDLKKFRPTYKKWSSMKLITYYVQHMIKYQGLLLKNGLNFKVNLEILAIRVNQ